MDNWVKEKLEKWNLSCLKDVFEENMIDEEAFLILNEETLKEMKIPIGPRIKLLKKSNFSKGFMKAITEHCPSKDDVLKDFHDDTFCKQHRFFSKENTVKLLLFVDDCEVANPFGSKAGLHRITNGLLHYIEFTTKASFLSNCFLLSLFNAGDFKTYGYTPFLQLLVDDVKFLEKEGVFISTDHFEGTVYAGITQITCDNLGVNGILGFLESFVSNHFCRHCNMHRNEMQRSSTACQEQLRTFINYEEHLQLNSYAETGIKSPCVLNEVENFHVTSNYAPDVMHDLLEGVCGLEVHLVLAQLIREGLFDLDLLNSRITSFDYPTTDLKNKPSPISNSRLQQPDGASGQTAAQMWCLFRNLPLLIGDKVPEGHPFFELLLMLLDCMDFIFCPENIKSILEESEVGAQVICELDMDKLSRKSRIKMVQILVAYIINQFGERQTLRKYLKR
ncbi:uncharacterized protein LOC124456174 [Xenia sp. Carnegie-2017]|uniref:uncharacterized protein LOC124456174 n=1 Tax=Xenia sp. Carnegie-2017 TaxID=2897299 RepID=UPI001F0475C5|nr:uncharacterized protein LOC124456174 [Xenia sp. Carnegie-2017]